VALKSGPKDQFYGTVCHLYLNLNFEAQRVSKESEKKCGR
jgi:hypothetical protein